MKYLITVNTCNRLSEVKKYIWDYLALVNEDNRFHFVLSLDGSRQDYQDFANDFDIPLIYSEQREGVGLSKNRVLLQFPDYDYYFFIDDDVELLDNSLFDNCIELMQSTRIHHICVNHQKSNTYQGLLNGFNVSHSLTGGGYFTCYSKKGIQAVGGFHPLFAKYKRYGHSEHSYRFMHAGLQTSPFIFFREGMSKLVVHSPPSVTSHLNHDTNKNEWISDEQELIDLKTEFYPLETICSFYFNQKPTGFNKTVSEFLKVHTKKYPLANRKQRRIALAHHFALRIPISSGFFQKTFLFLKSAAYAPSNNSLRHYIKTNLLGKN